MNNRNHDRGFTLIELVLSVAVALVISGVVFAGVDKAMDYFRASGDARGIASRLSVTKMQAGAGFTRARLSIDTLANSFQMEEWDKGTSQWTTVLAPTPLSDGVVFGAGGASGPPPGIADLNQKQPIVFNSRGVPVDGSGNPVSDYVIYLTNQEQTFALTVTVGGRITNWRFEGGLWSIY